VSAAHCAGRLEGWRRSVGLLREWAWLRSSEPLALDAIRDYWGERTGFLFAWQAFYVQALAPPAALGLFIWWRRPKGTSVDDDSAVPVFSLFSVVWAIFFVQLWRRKQAALAFRWGVHDAHTAQAEVRRPEFVGREVVSEITGEVELVEGRGSRALRYAASLCVSLACLIVPLAYMFVSLNLQGYISPAARHVLGVRVYHEALSAFAAPGAVFDPEAWTGMLPAVLHAAVIFLLNKAYRHVAEALTDLENHRTQEAHDNSLIVKRFLFEAFDCYIALFYIAFELRDVDRLRVELVSLFSTELLVVGGRLGLPVDVVVG